MPQQEYWGLYEKQLDGVPVRVRMNKGLEEYICHPRYMYQVTITVPLNDIDEHGMPFPEESRLLDELELLLRDRLVVHKVSVFVAVITTEGFQIFVLYTYMPDFCELAVHETNRLWIYHRLSCKCQEDREWEVVEGLL